MGGKRVCELCGVNESCRGGFFASFPLDENRCRTWVKIVGKEDLVYLPIEKLHKLRSICGDHFEKRDINKKGNRLKKRAYPKLNLLAAPLPDELLRDFPLHVASKTVSAPVEANPGTSHSVLVEHNLNVSAPVEATPGTSQQQHSVLVEHNLNAPAEATPGTSQQQHSVLVEHNLNVHTNLKRKTVDNPIENVKRIKSELGNKSYHSIEETEAMEPSKRHATAAQVAALVDFMHEHSELAKGHHNSGLERENQEARWQDLTTTLNSMGGSVKSVEKWKQTWRDLKSNTKKRALKQQQSVADISGDLEGSGDTSQNIDSDSYVPPQKRFASFDEEIIKIEKDKLEIEREYKTQKIAVLSRIASALEELAKKQ